MSPSPSAGRSRTASVHHRPAVAGLAVALVGALAALTVLSACTPQRDRARYEHLVYELPLPEFLRWWEREQAAALHVPTSVVRAYLWSGDRQLDSAAAKGRWFDVSTDGCSSAPDAGPHFDFRAACVRHDLAWRNLRLLDRRHGTRLDTVTNRLRANRRFLADMHRDCDRRATFSRFACRTTATAYLTAVDAAARVPR